MVALLVLKTCTRVTLASVTFTEILIVTSERTTVSFTNALVTTGFASSIERVIWNVVLEFPKSSTAVMLSEHAPLGHSNDAGVALYWNTLDPRDVMFEVFWPVAFERFTHT